MRRVRPAAAACALAVALIAAVTALAGAPSPRADATSAEVVIVGDSIVAGNVSYLGPTLRRAGLDVHIDAQSGRSIRREFTFQGTVVRSGVRAVRELRVAGARPSLWVIELGANEVTAIARCGCPDPVAFAGEKIDGLLAEIPAGGRVVWVTVHDRDEPVAAASFNTALRVRALAVIDWSGEVHGRSGLFLDDVHPSVAGVGVLGELLVRQIRAYLGDDGLDDLQARRLGVTWYGIP